MAHLKRWIGIGSAVAVIVLGAALHRAASADPDESCGLGLPPDAAGFAEAEARKSADLKQNGFLRVCESDIERYDISFHPAPIAEAGLAFPPVDLSRTPFAHFENLGGRAERIADTRSRLYRGFRMPEGHTLTLLEHDMSADGSSIWRDPKDEQERIKGLPARLGVFETPSGKAISHLSWKDGRRYYELWIDANVAREPLRDKLFALAASLPPAVPACPNEPPPRSARMGPDGTSFVEELPTSFTEEEFNAWSKAERPCK